MPKSWLLLILSSSLIAASAETNCHHAGGTISTNFIDASTTFGSANGDLGGGIGVSVLSIAQNSDGTLTLHNQHHWVTTTGATITATAAGHHLSRCQSYLALLARLRA